LVQLKTPNEVCIAEKLSQYNCGFTVITRP
jgi:hypothetical protein